MAAQPVPKAAMRAGSRTSAAQMDFGIADAGVGGMGRVVARPAASAMASPDAPTAARKDVAYDGLHVDLLVGWCVFVGNLNQTAMPAAQTIATGEKGAPVPPTMARRCRRTETVDLPGRDFLEIQVSDDVDALIDQQHRVHRIAAEWPRRPACPSRPCGHPDRSAIGRHPSMAWKAAAADAVVAGGSFQCKAQPVLTNTMSPSARACPGPWPPPPIPRR